MDANNVYIIAEAGVNHNGSIEIAKKMIDVAVESGADAIKFQTYKTELLVSHDAAKAEYQLHNDGNLDNQFQMLKKLELSFNDFKELADYCREKNIEFLSTAFDSESLKFLVEEINVCKLKIPSGEITNAPLIYEMAKYNLPLILSTGMTVMDDIFNALSIIAIATVEKDTFPSSTLINKYKNPDIFTKILEDKVTVLHCTTEYPTPFNEVNMRAMDYIKKKTNLEVGYSDHTKGILIPIIATARGARIIEKHFTLDKSMSGPDHKASLNPTELKEMVLEIRRTEEALGKEIKKITNSEKRNIEVARKSLIAKTDIYKGEIITPESIIAKRPGDGCSPFSYWDIVGLKASKDYRVGEKINERI